MSHPVPKNEYGQEIQQLGQAEPSGGHVGTPPPGTPPSGAARPAAAPGLRTPGGEPDTHAPYGYDPFGRPYSDKSKFVAGALSIVLGPLGIGRFYTGHTRMAVGQLVTLGGLGVWSLFDGILMLISNGKTDAEGRVLRG
ncbi:TM2 domain-containing protein [Streptomyces sp. NPDC127108]|uniref:TM2 domain-containing protein n=1 Tax=Streptomyces sp. NPDC127108 TaxID=3345361 RepID=UPI0036382A6D